MSRRSRPQYRSGLGWILGVAFEDTLTRPVRLAQGFTCVRCCGTPRASSPHDLTAPALASHDGRACVQLPLPRGCYHLAPRRTFTSNPVPMPGTPTVGLRPHSRGTAAAHSHPGCRIALPQEDSIPRKGGQYWTRKGVAIGRDLTILSVDALIGRFRRARMRPALASSRYQSQSVATVVLCRVSGFFA